MFLGLSLVAQTVESPPAMQETRFNLQSWEDPEAGMATHSSIRALGEPGTEEPGELQSMGSHEPTR